MTLSYDQRKMILTGAIVAAWVLLLSLGSVYEYVDTQTSNLTIIILLGGVTASTVFLPLLWPRVLGVSKTSNAKHANLHNLFSSISHKLLVGTLLFLTGVLFFNFDSIWVTSSHGIPSFSLFALLLFFACTLFVSEWVRAPGIKMVGNLIAACILLVVYLSETVLPLGDDTWLYDATNPEFFASSIFAHISLFLAHTHGLDLHVIAPICGFVTAFLYLMVCDYLLKDMDQFGRILGKLCYLGTSVHLLFFFGYVEVTMMMLPSLLLFIFFFIKYLESNEQGCLYILCASMFFGVSVLTHGQAIFLFPAIPLLVIWKNDYVHGWRKSLKELAMSVACVGAIVIVSTRVIGMWGFKIKPGDVYGADYGLFTPLVGPWEGPSLWMESKFTHGSLEHLVEVGNILLMAAPVAVAWGILFAYQAMFGKPIVSRLKDVHSVALTILSLGYVGLIVSFHFDLGYPFDLDLMMSMSLPMSLLFIRYFAADVQRTPILGGVVVLLCIVLTWSFIPNFLVKHYSDDSVMGSGWVIGRHVSDVYVMGNIGVKVEIDQAGWYEHVDLESGSVPSHIAGRVLVGMSIESQVDLAIAVNGVIQAVTRIVAGEGDTRVFSASVPESSFQRGNNVIEVFIISMGHELLRTQISMNAPYSLVEGDERVAKMITTSSGESIPVIADSVEGFLKIAMAVSLRDLVEFGGWVVEGKNSHVVDAILIFVDGTCVFYGSPNMGTDFPGVSNNPASQEVGFQFKLPLPLFSGVPHDKVRFFAMANGVASELHYLTSYTWPMEKT